MPDAARLAWAVSLITALMLLPVGAMRMLIYRSRQVDHTKTHHFVAWLALGLGGVALVVFLVLTFWFVATGRRPV